MPTFRKKPVEIEAFPADEAMGSATEQGQLPEWLSAAFAQGRAIVASNGIRLKTLEGWLEAVRGDWIIKGIQGELYPCKPDIFASTYEAVVKEKEHSG